MFNKNLEHIDNEALKRRLSRISDIESRMGISYCVTPSNDYVLLKDDLPSDDLQNPREAVKQMLKNNIKNEMKSTDTIITFGIGLGYLLDETFNRYPSKIYVYEPDLKLLHFVLQNVDLSEHLSSGRVYISNDLDELVAKLSSSFITQDKVEVVYLQNYAVTKNKELLLLTQKVLDTCKTKMVDINTITKFSKVWLLNAIHNIAAVNAKDSYLLSDLAGKFIGQTALVAGAGPSLNDNIANIQANRDKFVIFAVNKSVKYLLENGVTPDFVVCLDAGNMDVTLGAYEGYLSRSNAIVDIRTDKAIMGKNFNKIFLNFTDTDSLIKKLAKYNSFMNFYESGGSAATLALTAAVKLGFSKVVIAGIDLAFKDNVIYSNGSVMKRVSHDEIIVDNVKKSLTQVKSVRGGVVTTRDDYQAFIHHFEVLIKSLNYSEIYNISSFGAYINGVKNVSFEDLNLNTHSSMQQVAFAQPFKFETKEFIQSEFLIINNIISLLSRGIFSPVLVAEIVKSTLIYQYMQTEILETLQKNFAPELAENFVDKTKKSIKIIVETLQKNKLI